MADAIVQTLAAARRVSTVLFVSNGHGEAAIAARLAAEQRTIGGPAADHLALVGDAAGTGLREVGPRRRMPSGGLIAMGNVAGIVSDVAAGLPALVFEQLRFLRAIRSTYRVAVAVGDVWSLMMTLRAHAAATVFVGTAKSVHVAPYGPFEERVLRRARAVFVRDEATAQRLELHGVPSQAANVIADLADDRDPMPQELAFDPDYALFPGSRENAYADAVFLCDVVRTVVRGRAGTAGALLSIAPALSVERFIETFRAQRWDVRTRASALEPFSVLDGEREIARAWCGPIGSALRDARLVLGQAGTANEAAAAAGIPVVAFVKPGERGKQWYRRRQAALLDGALAFAPRVPGAAAEFLSALLADAQRLERMARIGEQRVGPKGARTIATRIVELCERAA